MIKLHPAIVHFPIALLLSADLFALISLFAKKEFFKEVAFWNLLLGVTGTIAAVFTGLIEEQNLVHNEEIHQVLVKHKFTGFGILILSFALLTWVWMRKNKFGKKEYILWVLFLAFDTLMIFYQGFLGGKMVFEQGAGVKPMELHIEQKGGSMHNHSNSGHDHDTTLSKKTVSDEMQGIHPNSGNDQTNKPNTSIKQDSSWQMKEKKKELKDMKY
jgi:uncharacterized membrane protein